MMVAICDDDPSDAQTLREFVESYSQNIKPDIFNSAKSLLEAVHSGQAFDVIFLDIIMDEPNGYEAAKHLKNNGSESLIVFVTESKQYVLAGYEFAWGYARKPIAEKKAHSLLYKAQKYFEPRKIMVNADNGKVLVCVRDILYFEISGRSVTLHTSENEYQFQSSLKNQAKSLPLDMFFQPHESFLINLDKIESVSPDSKTITLHGGASIPLSRKRKDLFYKSLAKHHFLTRDMAKEI
jgi:DNA-binding LytR/AlgR family response regulator